MNVSAIVMDSVQTGLACMAIGCTIGVLSSIVKQKKGIKTREQARASMPASVTADPELRNALVALLDVARPDLPSFERATRRVADLQQLFADVTGARPSTVAANLYATASDIQASFVKYLRRYYWESDIRLIKEEQEYGTDFVPLHIELRSSHVLVRTLVDALVHQIRMVVADKLDLHAGSITFRNE
jgi:hypothetical protein